MTTPIDARFIGSGIRATDSDYLDVALMIGVEEAAFRAVCDVEARSSGFGNSVAAPIMLYEPHIAYRRTHGSERQALVNAGVAYAKWGTRKYPRSQQSRYYQLETAISICGDKAFEFASYGLPQMMGFNFAACGFSSAVDLFEEFKTGERAQLQAMGRFIASNKKMLEALKQKDWMTFKRLYNGPGKNDYHVRLRVAYQKRLNSGSHYQPGALDDGFLGIGDKGPIVEKLQKDLNALGYGPITVDGDYGQITAAEVAEFQRDHGITVDGKAGSAETLPAVRKALEESFRKGAKYPPTSDGPAIIDIPDEPMPFAIADMSPSAGLKMPDEPKSLTKSKTIWGTVGNYLGSGGAGYYLNTLLQHPDAPLILGIFLGLLLIGSISAIIVFRERVKKYIDFGV